MASVGMDSSLHLLAERAAGACSWPQLHGVVHLHRQLVAAMARLQREYVGQLSVVLCLITSIGLLGVFRVSMAVPDVNNAAPPSAWPSQATSPSSACRPSWRP